MQFAKRKNKKGRGNGNRNKKGTIRKVVGRMRHEKER